MIVSRYINGNDKVAQFFFIVKILYFEGVIYFGVGMFI